MKFLLLIPALSLPIKFSGNGLVSYYINLILEGVGVTDTKTKVSSSVLLTFLIHFDECFFRLA